MSTDIARQKIAKLQQASADQAKEAWKQGKISPNTRNTNLNYWIEKTGGDVSRAVQLQKERQSTFSLVKCIEKLGPELGVQRWKERQLTWQRNFKKQNYSTISQELFKLVCVELPSDIVDVYYATSVDNGLNNEVALALEHSVCKPDFYIPSLQFIAEFDGTYWHRTSEPEYRVDCDRRDSTICRVYPNMTIVHITEQQFKEAPNQCVALIVEAVLDIYNRQQASKDGLSVQASARDLSLEGEI